MSTALQNGAVFAGRYRILGCIATGGMGAGVDEATRMPFLVMELLRGDELSSRPR